MIARSSAVAYGAEVAARAHATDHYRPDIDGLRAVAVLAVIGFHAYPGYFPGGFVGVDVFFVISGFLITSIILRQMRRGTFTLAEFYARRVRRIFPALAVVLPACLLFGWFALLPDELEHLGKHVAAAAAFLSNFVLWQESGYFDPAAELKPLLHLWSLGIEEQFYLIWPLTLLLLWKRRLNIIAIVALLTLASFAFSVVIGPQKPIANFYLPFSRFWELGLGCLLAIVKDVPGGSVTRWLERHDIPRSRYPLLRSKLRSLLPIAGIALIVAAVFLFDRHTTFPGWAALLPTVGAMCIISARGDAWFQRRVMASGPMVFIGLISYPLYLWHWPLLSFATILESGTPDSTVRITLVLFSVLLAWLTYALIERPARTRRSTRVAWSLASWLVIAGATGVLVYATAGFGGRFDADVRALRPERRLEALCTAGFPRDRDFNYCKSTSREPPVAVFLGDSQAQAIYDGVAAEIGARHSVTLLGRGGCPPLLNVPGTNERGCNDVWNLFVGYVEKVRPPVVVIVGGGSPLLQGATAALAVHGIPFPLSDDQFKQGLRTLLVTLQVTSRVIYVREIPRFASAPSCFLRQIKLPGSQCTPTLARAGVEAKMASYNRIVDELQQELPRVRVVDSISVLCGSSACSQQATSGEILYSDQLHLSPIGGRYFAAASGLPDILLRQLRVAGGGRLPARAQQPPDSDGQDGHDQ